jgi:hypothetical protein
VGCHLPGSSSRGSGCRYLGARASADSVILVPVGQPRLNELEQSCQSETVPFPFASWATSETGTSPITRGEWPGERSGKVVSPNPRFGLSFRRSVWMSVAERCLPVCRSSQAVRGCLVFS